MPVTTCTMKTASVALPSVCPHVRLPGILRSSNCSLMPRRSTRSSSQRKIGVMISCLDARGHAQPIFLVLHVDGALADLYLELVQRTGRRSVEHGAGLEVESPVVAGTEEILGLCVPHESAPKVRAPSAIRLELLPVLGEQPQSFDAPALDPRILF